MCPQQSKTIPAAVAALQDALWASSAKLTVQAEGLALVNAPPLYADGIIDNVRRWTQRAAPPARIIWHQTGAGTALCRSQQPGTGQDAMWLVLHKGQFSVNCVGQEVANIIQHPVHTSLVEALNKETDEYEEMIQVTVPQQAIQAMQTSVGGGG